MAPEQRSLTAKLANEIEGAADLFSSLWPGYEEPLNTLPPHRQRTSVNKLAGYAHFLGMPTAKGDPAAVAFRRVKAWQKRIGPLRDCDVMRQWTDKFRDLAGSAADDAANAFDSALLARRTLLLQPIRLDARGVVGAQTRVALQVLLSDFGRALERVEAAGTFNSMNALATVATPWSAALDVLRSAQEDTLLHAFRVTNKRLRFVLELLAETEPDPDRRELLKSRAKVAAQTHTALGNLSDLHVLRGALRLERAKWGEERRGLEDSAAELEMARARLEAENFRLWFDCWPRISDPAFLGDMLG